jgi:mono/diheme cytochrome c family protein
LKTLKAAMQYKTSYRLLVVLLGISFLIGCTKKNADKPAVKSAKDSSALVKDSTAKDSASTSKDSLSGASDSSVAIKDSAALAKDSIRVADSLASHPMTYEQRQGKYVYVKYCAICHGNEGKADGFNTYNLDPKPRDLTEQHYLSEFSDERLIQIIRDGGRGANKSPSMPPYGWTLGKDDIAYVTAFVRTFMPMDSLKKQK